MELREQLRVGNSLLVLVLVLDGGLFPGVPGVVVLLVFLLAQLLIVLDDLLGLVIEVIHVDVVLEHLGALLELPEVGLFREGPHHVDLAHPAHVVRGDLAHVALAGPDAHGLTQVPVLLVLVDLGLLFFFRGGRRDGGLLLGIETV